MKFTCESEEIKRAIQNLSRIASKSNIDPILECVYINNENHNLTLRCSNLEVIAELNIAVKSEINGSVLVNINLLNKIINNISKSSEVFNFELIDNTLNITNNKNITSIEVHNETIFPKIKNGGDKILSIKKDLFINTLKSVSFCASQSEIKPEISSVFIQTRDNNITSTATDSYRLAEKKSYLETEENLSILIPQKNINQIMSILDFKSEDNVDIYKNEDIIIIENGNNFISSRIINGQYPDYKQLFPKSFECEMIVRKDVLLNALELASVISQNTPICKIEYTSNNRTLKISSEEKGLGKMSKEIEVESEYVDDFVINYNSNFFIEGLNHIEGDKVKLKLTTPNRPMFIESISDASFIYLIMPVNR